MPRVHLIGGRASGNQTVIAAHGTIVVNDTRYYRITTRQQMEAGRVAIYLHRDLHSDLITQDRDDYTEDENA